MIRFHAWVIGHGFGLFGMACASGMETRDSPDRKMGMELLRKGAAMGTRRIVFLSLATSWSDEVDSCTDSSEEHEALDDIAAGSIPQDAENTGTTQILLNTENMQIVPILIRFEFERGSFDRSFPIHRWHFLN